MTKSLILSSLLEYIHLLDKVRLNKIDLSSKQFFETFFYLNVSKNCFELRSILFSLIITIWITERWPRPLRRVVCRN